MSPCSPQQVTGPQRGGTCRTVAGHGAKGWQCQQDRRVAVLEKFNQRDPMPAQSIPTCPPGK